MLESIYVLLYAFQNLKSKTEMEKNLRILASSLMRNWILAVFHKILVLITFLLTLNLKITLFLKVGTCAHQTFNNEEITHTDLKFIDFLPKYFGTIIIVLLGIFDKTKSIDITHIGFAIGSQEIKTTHSLLQNGEKNENNVCI